MTKTRSNSQNEEDQDCNIRNKLVDNDEDDDNDEVGGDVFATLRLVDTTDQALELIDSLSNQQQRFEGEDPGDLFDQMDEMRQNLQSAWKDVLLVAEENNHNNNINRGSTSDNDKVEDSSLKRGRDGQAQDSTSNSSSSNMTEEEYRSSYVETMTKVLAEPLDAIREQQQQQHHEQDRQPSKNGNKGGLDIDVDLIVDALQSGIDLLHPEEKMLFLEELQAMEEEEQNEADTTTTKGESSIHMMRRKELGYDV